MRRTRFHLAVVLVFACGSWSIAQSQDQPQNNNGQGRGQGRRQADRQGRGQGRGQGQGQGQGRGFRGQGRGQGQGPGQGQGQGPGRGQGRGPGRGGRGPGGGPGFDPRFGEGPGSPNFTPEQRDEFYRRMVDRQMGRLSEAYELTDDQKQQVRQRVEALRQEDMAGAEQRYQQMSGLREQFRQLRQRRDAGEQIPPESWQQIDGQMREVMRSSPLLNRERIMGEVEPYVTPEQAAKGRERLERQAAERDRRQQEMRQQWEQLRQQGIDPGEYFRQQRQRRQQDQNQQQPQPQQDPNQPQPELVPQEQPPQDGNQDQDAERQRRRAERQRRQEEWRQANPQNGDNNGNADNGQNDDGEGRRRGRRNQELPADPLGPWERYVRDFTAKYDLDPSQQSVAQSILRDMLTQRKFFEDNHRKDIAIAQQVEDPGRRQQQIESINAPVVRMFDELKAKLERIPTAAQRESADGPRPTSRPAGVSTRPADGPTTRPARDRERRGSPGDNLDRPRGPRGDNADRPRGPRGDNSDRPRGPRGQRAD